jgi:SAM-dependent methyltransferase
MMPATAPSVAETYDAFAPLYDRFTAASNYEAVARSLDPLLCGLDRSMLDLACGTGNSYIPFLRRGYAVTGCDVSRAMIALARSKTPDANLFVADMRRLGRVGRFGLVTCLDDSLNYLHRPADLGAAFASITRNLAPDGLAVFDLNTLLAYRTTFASETRSAADEVEFTWRGLSSPGCGPGCLAEAVIEAELEAGGVVVTRHVQRHYRPSDVLGLLASAGLECRGLWGLVEDGSLVPALDESTHLKAVYLVGHRDREGR